MFYIDKKHVAYGEMCTLVNNEEYRVIGKDSDGKNVLIGIYSGKELREWVEEDLLRVKRVFSNASLYRGDICFIQYHMRIDTNHYCAITVNFEKVDSYYFDIRGNFGVITLGNSIKKRYLQLFDWVLDLRYFSHRDGELTDDRPQLSGVDYFLIDKFKFNWGGDGWSSLVLKFYDFDRYGTVYRFTIASTSYVHLHSSTEYTWSLNIKTGKLKVSDDEIIQLKHVNNIDLRYSIFT